MGAAPLDRRAEQREQAGEPARFCICDQILAILSQGLSWPRVGFAGRKRCAVETHLGFVGDFETCIAIEKQVRERLLLAKVGLPPGLPAPSDEASFFLA